MKGATGRRGGGGFSRAALSGALVRSNQSLLNATNFDRWRKLAIDARRSE
jgi:hypothetical protein